MANGYSIHVAAHKSQKIGASKAPGAELAAVAMHEIAVGLGYTESVLLVDTQATTQKFKDELQRLAGKLHAGDILFVSLAGTGKALAESTDCPHAHDQGVNLFDDLLVDDEIYCRLSKITVNARVIVVADVCDGIHPTCPVDAFAPSGTFCGSSADTDCTNRDTCDRAGTCRANNEARGTTCSDGDACTTGDQCDGTGSCTGGTPTICPACELCRSDAGCVAAIDLACEPGVPGTSTLTISNNPGTANDELFFDWTGANPIAKTDFGSPLSLSDYQLCIYDDKAAPGEPHTLVYALSADAGGVCGRVPCWFDLRWPGFAGFLYYDNELTPDGVQLVLLEAGRAGKSQVSVTARGRNLGLVPHDSKVFFSQSNKVTAVLVANGAPKCFRAEFTRPWLKNLPSGYKDRS